MDTSSSSLHRTSTSSIPDDTPPEIKAAYHDARSRGLPDGWTCSIDKRNRRKWTAPNGRSCDSIPKALAISVELGLLPPDTVIPSGKRKRSDKSSRGSRSDQPRSKKAAPTPSLDLTLPPPPRSQSSSSRSATATARPRQQSTKREPKSVGGAAVAAAAAAAEAKPKEEDATKKKDGGGGGDSNEEYYAPPVVPVEPMDPEVSLDVDRRAVTTVHWDPQSPDGSKIGWKVRIGLDNGTTWVDGRITRYDPYSHKHKIVFSNNKKSTTSSSSLSSPTATAPSELTTTTTTATPKTSSGSVPAASRQSQRQRLRKDRSCCSVWIWLRNDQHNLHVATRMVWAHVKGYAWWPGLVMECNTKTVQHKEGHVLVEFFGSGEVSNLRDSPDSIRPFKPDAILDPVIAKHKKKRSAKAFQLACEEYERIMRVRNEAIMYYAAKAARMSSAAALAQQQQQASSFYPHCLIGKRVEIFRSDVNYPYGETLVGKVRQYSTIQKKWLLAFELSARTKYSAKWINLQAKETQLRVLDKKKSSSSAGSISDEDLLPFVYGFEQYRGEKGNEQGSPLDDEEGGNNDATQKAQTQHHSMTAMACLLRERCHGCAEYWKKDDIRVTCRICKTSRHLACLDPPLEKETWVKMMNTSADLYVCSRCTSCRGCYQKDIVFGSHTLHPMPPTLSFPAGENLNLCSVCREAYEKERFCPNCAHSWDDVKFQKVRKQMECSSSSFPGGGGSTTSRAGRKRRPKHSAIASFTGSSPPLDEIIVDDMGVPLMFGSFQGDEDLPLGATVNPWWFHPETSEWGYTEVEMLVCDHCKIWVHAGCAGVTEEEYNMTSEGNHPIYCKEFLCRVCCRQRSKDIIEALQKEDTQLLFAVPVTEKVAPNYRDVIKKPMDLQTMLRKAESEEYPNYAWVRELFELTVLNALTFNRYFTTVWNEAARFYHDSLKKVFETIGKAAPPGRYEQDIQRIFEMADEALKMEEARVQVDETVQKKDLVAGAIATPSITLPKLRENSPDQVSCLPFCEVKLKPVDALYCAWMECCYTCGTSGAMDTMLFCADCGEAFHSFCANAPIHSMEASSVAGWRCPNCKICEISGDVPRDETRMLFCEMCDRAFSLDLLDPPLKAAPTGLWICGQCVDCEVCGNAKARKDSGGRASKKRWSRFPDKCYHCGGCCGEGLAPEGDKAGASRCSICDKPCALTSADAVECFECDARVHAGCDIRAEMYIERRESAGRRAQGGKKIEMYRCPACIKLPPVERGNAMVDRKGLNDQAWLVILAGSLQPHDNYSHLELHEKLADEIDWRMRDIWREDYVGLISEAFRVLSRARDSFGDPRIAVQRLLKGAGADLPKWAGQRALRFVIMAKRCKWQSDRLVNASQGIDKIVLLAKLASAFVQVACRAMGISTKMAVIRDDRVQALLVPPDEGGTLELPLDPIRRSDEDIVEMDGTVLETRQPERRPIQSESFVEAEKQEQEPVKLPAPVCGWNSNNKSGGQSAWPDTNHATLPDTKDAANEWKDPRECCLCHQCGDDDAGLQEGEPQVDDDDDGDGGPSKPDLAHAGRLLPMPDGLWVHTHCALWSSEVYEDQSDGLVHAVDKARSRGAQLKCFGCGRHGATVGCNKSNCSFNYHFQCAKACGAVFTSTQQMFCANHRSSATGILPRESYEIMKAIFVAPEKKATAEKDNAESSDMALCSRVGSLVVHSLGEIEQTCDGFHSENYITPLGYVATRIFWSTLVPRSRTVYILKVERSTDNRAEFSIVPGDSPSEKISGHSVSQVYSTLVDRVRKVNAQYFSQGDLYSKLPVVRRTRRKTFGLNGPQFFGFGLNHIRKALEVSPGIEAVVAPLTSSSPGYRFCFVQPPVESILDLQRKRAAAKAEKALENSSGCARTEGMKAVARSGGSGRITRALVRSAEEEGDTTSTSATSKKSEEKAKADRNRNQVKYRRMKSVPMEQRLVARRSHIHGWGLFTKLEITKDDPIVEYMGEIIRQPMADKREKAYEISGEGSCYMFRLDLQRIVDATMIGCMARFMNHSCQPNAYAKIIHVDSDQGQEKKIVVFANRDISSGEEITYDYKFPVEDGSLRCTCGAAECIGRLN